MKIISVVGARPNFMKIAPFMAAIRAHNGGIAATERASHIEHLLVHTGQHYDDRMSRAFFEALGIPDADINLGIGSGTHAEQVGRTMIEFEKVVREHRPDWVVVVGDVNATCACSITAKKERIKLAHIEAGLRSFDLDMPEEINRMVTDRLSDLLFTPDRLSCENLRNEGVCEERIKFVGNIMIDTLEANRATAAALDPAQIIRENLLPTSPPQLWGRAEGGKLKAEMGGEPDARGLHSVPGVFPPLSSQLSGSPPHPTPLASPASPQLSGFTPHPSSSSPQLSGFTPHPSPYAVMTMHRPSNVDEESVLRPIIEFLCDEVAADMPLFWPIHPRARKQLEKFGLWDTVSACEALILLHPLGYHELLRLNLDAALVLTDSGGLQEECCVLGTPCLTLRWNTERPVTLREHGGASVLVGNDIDRIRAEYEATKAQTRTPSRPELWDGRTAERIVKTLAGM